jgi:hypothetical protein
VYALAPLVPHRGHDRQLGQGQFIEKVMFFLDLLTAPAPGPVEFDDNRFGGLNADLIDPVFVTVEGQHAAITAQTRAFNSCQYEIRGKGIEWLELSHNFAGINHSGMQCERKHGSLMNFR